jgi:hypothetical protein
MAISTVLPWVRRVEYLVDLARVSYPVPMVFIPIIL